MSTFHNLQLPWLSVTKLPTLYAPIINLRRSQAGLARTTFPSLHIILTALFLGLSPAAFGQERTIHGRVADEDDQAIAGVGVSVKGTTLGAVTNIDGHYKVTSRSDLDVILIFSFVGYKTLEIEAGSRSVIDVRLEANITQLKEIIVTGYSVIERKDLSSSISVVDVEAMQQYSSSNFGEQLQGKVPGVQINTTNDPGSSQSVRIRGIGSVNNNEPLYVIDGVPVQNDADMNFLNPGDIESMQVLKDAAAASIYGARAANGVIVITTKRGGGQPKLVIDLYSGIQVITRTPEVANPGEVLEIEKGLAEGAGLPLASTLYVKDDEGNWTLPDYYVYSNGYKGGDPAVDPSRYILDTTPTGDYSHNYPITKTNKDGTDWFREMFRPASITNLQISASGGSQRSNFYVSANYFDQQGIMIRNFYRRFQTRLNGSFAVTNNLTLGENLNIAYQTTDGALGSGSGINGSISPAIWSIIDAGQIIPLYDINGYWASNNPVARQNRIADGSKQNTFRVTGNIFAELSFLNNFNFKTNFGLDTRNGPKEDYAYSCPECPPNQRYPNSLSLLWFNQSGWVWTNTITFNKYIGDHRISVLAGTEARIVYYEQSSAQGSRLSYGDDPNFRILDNTDPESYNISSSKTEIAGNSIFFSGNYNFKDKYLFTVSVRRDGSSKFINNRYGTFPAASLAWRISNESFMGSAGFVNDLKLRLSYGTAGNNEVLGGNYPGYTNYITSKYASSYDIRGTGNSIVAGFSKNSVGNPDLRWETSILADIGLDIAFGRNFELTADWFRRKTEDMIYPVTLPLQSGAFFQNQNIGSMLNKGVEIQFTFSKSHPSNLLRYSIALTATHYKNKVLALGANTNTFVDAAPTRNGFLTRTEAGYPISQFRGYIADGLWQSTFEIDSVLFADPGGARPGRMKFRDLNKDGRIDSKDLTFIGNPIPKLLLGLTLALEYKAFDFTAYVTGAFDRDVYDYQFFFTDFNSPSRTNPSKRMLYDAGVRLPVLDYTDSYSSVQSSYYVRDASYTRLRNIVIGYTFPEQLTSRIGLRKARIYLQGQNLFTWTSYHGLDPEGSVINIRNGYESGRDYVIGVDNYDWGRYPPARQIIVGMNFEF